MSAILEPPEDWRERQLREEDRKAAAVMFPEDNPDADDADDALAEEIAGILEEGDLDKTLADEINGILEGEDATPNKPAPLSTLEIFSLLDDVKRLVEQAIPDIKGGHISETDFSLGEALEPDSEYARMYAGELPPAFHLCVIVTPTRAKAHISVPNRNAAAMDLDPRCWDDFVGWVSMAVGVYEDEKTNFAKIQKMLGR